MVTFIKGDIFKSPAQVLTNTVNCVGVMGKGVALEFKNRFPDLFTDYKNRCARGEVKPGRPYLWEDEQIQILNFPTKRHWREPSLLEDIEKGLEYLALHYDEMSIQSIAMPALGCGNGGLNWQDVKPLIERYLGSIPDLDVYVYEPQAASSRLSSTDSALSGETASTDQSAARPAEI